MSVYLVTLKLPKNSEHNPRDKKTGRCPADQNGICTDQTGEHHTVLIVENDIVQAKARFPGQHITRIEVVPVHQEMGGKIICGAYDGLVASTFYEADCEGCEAEFDEAAFRAIGTLFKP